MYGDYRKSLFAVLSLSADQAERILGEMDKTYHDANILRQRWTDSARKASEEYAKTKQATELAISALRKAVKDIGDA